MTKHVFTQVSLCMVSTTWDLLQAPTRGMKTLRLRERGY